MARRLFAVLAALLLFATPATAHHAKYAAANDTRVSTLEARVSTLEAAIVDLQAQVDALKPTPTPTPTATPTPTPTPAPTATPTPAPTPAPIAGMWGGIGGNTLANTQIANVIGAWSFRASRSLPVPSFRAYFTGGPGYGEGNGGTYTFNIRPDDGSGHPNLNGTSYGVATAVTGFPPSVGNQPGKLITLSSTSALTAGERYWVVMQNVGSSPDSNNTSANALWSYSGTPPHFRWADPLDWTFMYQYNGNWTTRTGYAMVSQLNYSDGSAQGQPYMEMSYSDIPQEVGEIRASTNRLIRQPFKPTSAVDVIRVGLALQKASGSTGALTVAIRDGGSGRGALIASVTIPASAIPDGSMSGSNIGSTKGWATALLASPLSASTTYRLEFSTTGNSQMMTWPIRLGGLAGYGYSNAIDSAFPGGLPWQYSTDGGSTWTNGSGNDDQLQAYLGWAP